MLSDCLAGTRVLDLSQYLPGPYATQILADLGAEVVKVEPPRGDPGRTLPPLDGDGIGLGYKLINRGKRRIVVDLKSSSGKDAFAALASAADVMLESYRPGVMDRLGFGLDRLRGINPRLVACSLTGYGQAGPLRDAAGHDVNYMAAAGAFAGIGTAEGGPILVSPPVADRAGAMTAALAILAALMRRERTGQGGHLDVALTDAILAWQQGTLTAVRAGVPVVRGAGSVSGGGAYYNIYRTRDGGYVTLGAMEPKFWRNFCMAVQRPAWVERQFEPFPQRALIAELGALFATRDRAAWEALLMQADCCFMPALTPEEVAAHPQFAARATLIRHADGIDEVPFPVPSDGVAAPARTPLEDTTAEDVLAGWSAAPR